MSISQFINRFSTTLAKSNPKISSSIRYLLKPLPIGCRSIHGDDSDKTQAQNQNPPPKIPNISQESEKICILLVNQSCKYDTDSALKSVEVDVSAALVAEVLNRLSNSGVLALSFFRWAEKQNGFKHTAETYNALIEALGKIKQFKLIWNLVSDMKQKGVLGKETFSLISRRYARAKMVKEAVEAFERMEKYGFKPELCDYNRLLDLLSKSRQVERAQELFDKMKNRKFKPDIKSYTILLEGWGQAQNMLRLDEVFREMKGDGFQPDAVTYGIITHAYCKAKRLDEAIEKFREMEAKNIKPTPHVFSILINGLGNEKRSDEALKFFQLSKDFWFPPDAPTYNAAVGAFCWSMRISDAYQVVEEMKEHGVGPNARTYDIILHHLIKAGRTEDAYTTFNIMRNMPGCEPVLSTYEIIVRMFCNTNQTDSAVMVWEQMKAKGVVPAMHMFSTLINNLCHENKLNEACAYFQEMLHMGIRPPAQTFSILKEALVEAGKQHTVVFLNQKLEDIRKTQLV